MVSSASKTTAGRSLARTPLAQMFVSRCFHFVANRVICETYGEALLFAMPFVAP